MSAIGFTTKVDRASTCTPQNHAQTNDNTHKTPPEGMLRSRGLAFDALAWRMGTPCGGDKWNLRVWCVLKDALFSRVKVPSG